MSYISYRLLSNINSPDDIKKLSYKSLDILSDEIRRFLIESISKTGGHLASNLGIVELTLALHYCFDSPKDKIIWDVGHQTYVHKILTGRRDRFDTLRQLDGMSGFPKTSESEHDAFDTGHASTSISAALGYCIARDLSGGDNKVVAVIGDGSMTGGLSYEALNNGGRSNTDLIVVLNDNQMSISENVGGLSRHLNEIRTAPSYLDVKDNVTNVLNKIPRVGGDLIKLIEKAKGSIRYLVVPGVLFDELGFTYIGPVDGHNVRSLVSVLRKVIKMTEPVLIHVYTTKGKGYFRAEEYPTDYHGVESFNIDTGKPVVTKKKETYSDVFGSTMVKLASENKKIVAVTAAMPLGTGLEQFMVKFPNRIFDVGIAESHAVTFAAGLAKSGYIPVFAVYSSFLQRSYDQIVHDVCMQKLPVIFAIDRAGIVGADGETHQGVFDLSFLSHIPNIMVMAPKNKKEFRQMLEFSVGCGCPVAIRYPRGSASDVLNQNSSEILPGKWEVIDYGISKNIAIISFGAMMDNAYEVYKKLKSANLSPALVNARFIKPMDAEAVKTFGGYKYIFSIEENIYSGGFAGKLLECFAKEEVKYSHFKSFSLPDEFIPQGTREELLKHYGLDAHSIYEKIIYSIGACNDK